MTAPFLYSLVCRGKDKPHHPVQYDWVKKEDDDEDLFKCPVCGHLLSSP